MSNHMIGCGQITWSGLERKWTADEVLGEIAQAGYDGAPAGPTASASWQEIEQQFEQLGLRPAPGYLSGAFWEKDAAESLLERAHAFGQFSQALGITEVYVAAGGFNDYITPRGQTRNQIAGNVQPEDSMTDAEFEQFAETLTEVGKITLQYGLRSCFHNHVGSTIETRQEIDRLFNMVDRDAVFLGPDTGHLEWAGADALDFCQDYADSIFTIHVKDIDKTVMAEGVAARWDYGTFSKHGIWTELGQGSIDFPAIFSTLEQAGFDGWIIVETDVTQLASPLESAQVSRAYLTSIGY